MRPVGLTLAIFLTLATAIFAQTTARTATEAEAGEPSTVQVESPMLLEVALDKAKLHLRPRDSVWTTTETAHFHCDKARVSKIEIFRRKGKKGRVKLEIAPTVATDWYRQHIDLRVKFRRADGEVIAEEEWKSVTIGRDQAVKDLSIFGASKSKAKVLEVEMTAEELEALYEQGGPSLEIVVSIND